MAENPFKNLTPEQAKGLREAARYFGAEGYKGRLKRATSTKRIVDYKKDETKKLIASKRMAESVKNRTPAQSTSASNTKSRPVRDAKPRTTPTSNTKSRPVRDAKPRAKRSM